MSGNRISERMRGQNQLRARVYDETLEALEEVEQNHDQSRTDTERLVMRAGLQNLGYLEEDRDRAEAFLELFRKVGVTLGGAGMAATSFGIFGYSVMQFIGYGLVLAGFAAIAGAEFAPAIDSRIESLRGESA